MFKIIFGKVQFLFKIIWQLVSSIHASAEFAECRPVAFRSLLRAFGKSKHLHLTGTKPFADGGLDANSTSIPTILS